MGPWCSGSALQTVLSSVPLCSPFSGFLADRVPDGLQGEGGGYVWKWIARPIAGRLWEGAVPRPPQLDLNSRKSSGFLHLSRPLLIPLGLGILTHSGLQI